MRYFTGLFLLSIIGLALGCGGANNMNTNTTANRGNALSNVNVSNPPTGPAMPPPTMLPSNNGRANTTPDKRVPPGMANEKMTPGRMPPGLLGTPNKQPTPR